MWTDKAGGSSPKHFLSCLERSKHLDSGVPPPRTSHSAALGHSLLRASFPTAFSASSTTPRQKKSHCPAPNTDVVNQARQHQAPGESITEPSPSTPSDIPPAHHVCCSTSQPQGRVPSTCRQAPLFSVDTALLILRQRRGEALQVNITAAEGLQDVLKSNLGPYGTIKM